MVIYFYPLGVRFAINGVYVTLMAIRDLLRELLSDKRTWRLGKVVRVDKAKLQADFEIEGEDHVYEGVSLRVFNTDDDSGLYVIPPVGTWAILLIDEIDENVKRVRVVKFQEWEELRLKKPDFDVYINKDNKVYIEITGDVEFNVDGNIEGTVTGDCKLKVQGELHLRGGTHKAAWGDVWLQKFNAHIHPTPTGPSGPPSQPLVDSEVNSQKVKLD